MRQREMKFHVVTDTYNAILKNVSLSMAENAVRHTLDQLVIGASLMVVYTKGEFSADKPLYLHSKTTKLQNYVAK